MGKLANRLRALKERKVYIQQKITVQNSHQESPLRGELDAMVWACELAETFRKGLSFPFTEEHLDRKYVKQYIQHVNGCGVCQNAHMSRLLGKSEEDINKLRCPHGNLMYTLSMNSAFPKLPISLPVLSTNEVIIEDRQ